MSTSAFLQPPSALAKVAHTRLFASAKKKSSGTAGAWGFRRGSGRTYWIRTS